MEILVEIEGGNMEQIFQQWSQEELKFYYEIFLYLLNDLIYEYEDKEEENYM